MWVVCCGVRVGGFGDCCGIIFGYIGGLKVLVCVWFENRLKLLILKLEDGVFLKLRLCVRFVGDDIFVVGLFLINVSFL